MQHNGVARPDRPEQMKAKKRLSESNCFETQPTPVLRKELAETGLGLAGQSPVIKAVEIVQKAPKYDT